MIRTNWMLPNKPQYSCLQANLHLKKSMLQVVQLGIILCFFFLIYGGYHNICEFQHFCSKYFLYPFHILDTPENRKKNNVYFVLLLVWVSWYFGGISTVYYLSIGADHVTPTMTIVMVASSWIMHYFIKLNSSQTGFLNITVSSWYSNSVQSSDVNPMGYLWHVVEWEIHIRDKQQLCNAVMSTWTKVAEYVRLKTKPKWLVSNYILLTITGRYKTLVIGLICPIYYHLPAGNIYRHTSKNMCSTYT